MQPVVQVICFDSESPVDKQTRPLRPDSNSPFWSIVFLREIKTVCQNQLEAFLDFLENSKTLWVLLKLF